MSKKWLFPILLSCFGFLIPLRSAQDRFVRIWLFRGETENALQTGSIPEFMPLSLKPELSKIKAALSDPESGSKEEAIDCLMDFYDLKTLEELFLFEKPITKEIPNSSDVILGRQVAFRLDMALKEMSDFRLLLAISISRTKEGSLKERTDSRRGFGEAYSAAQRDGAMDTIIAGDLALSADDPIMLRIASGNDSYFVIASLASSLIKVTAAGPGLDQDGSSKSSLIKAPPVLKKVSPSYPEEKRRIKGDVVLRIALDGTGAVKEAKVVSHLDPYLDFAAVEALRQWLFEPVLHDGKPITVEFDYMVSFGAGSPEPGSALGPDPSTSHGEEAGDKTVRETLHGALDYCRKLDNIGTFFVCDESVRRLMYQMRPRSQWQGYFKQTDIIYEDERGITGSLTRNIPIMDPRRTIRSNYVCDYQLIRRDGKIIEQRKLKRGKRPVATRDAIPEEEKRLAAVLPFFAASRILDLSHQSQFEFRIKSEEKIHKKRTLILEAVPRFGEVEGIRRALIWIDPDNFQIHKMEVDGIPFEGFEDVLTDAIDQAVDAKFTRTYEYELEKDGVLFPKSALVQVKYKVSRMDRPLLKEKIDISYDSYKFFTVQTEHEIIKENVRSQAANPAVH